MSVSAANVAGRMPRLAAWIAATAAGVALIAAGKPPLLLPIALLGCAGALAVFADTRLGLCAAAFAIGPLGIIQAEIGSVTINFPEALILALFLKEAALFVLRNERPARDVPWAALAFYLVAGIVAIATGLLGGAAPRAVFQDWRQFTEYIVLFLLVTHRCAGPREATAILGSFVAGIALLALHGVLQRYTGIGIPGEQLISDLVYHGAVRSGSFYGATPLGALMVLALGPALGMLLQRRPRWQKAFLLVAALLLVTAAVFTKTRASWLAMAILLGLLFLAIPKRPGLVVSAVVSGLVFALVFGPEVVSRMGTLSFSKSERSLRQRVLYFSTAAHIARAHPVLGLGWGRHFQEDDILANGRYVPRAPEERPAGSPKEATVHSAYLQILVKTGFLGMIAFGSIIALWGISMGCACRAPKRSAPDFPLLAGASAALIGYFFHAGLENFFQWPVMAQSFWLLLGMTVVLARDSANVIPSRG